MDRRQRRASNVRARQRTTVASPAAGKPDIPAATSAAAAAQNEFAGPLLGRTDRLVAVVLVAAVFLAYQPCWHAGFIWDDNAHVTRPALRSWHGLYRIWSDVAATTQYYPLLHSVFWLEHILWGDAATGYHLANLALHACAAVLVLAVLRRLEIPGARLAAAIFALHPVHVESVAWITEQKNTLSAVFYLAAALLYLRFDRTRRPLWYLGAAGLFVAALLSKTLTGTLPGALLVVSWWQRGRLSWKRDVLPLLPLLLLGAGFGLLTAWWELKINQCSGPDFAFTFVQRLLIAGRTAWFCCWKLFWPAQLTFIYPRWQIDAGVPWQYLFPLAALALLALAWAIRHRCRAPLATLLYFGGTLFPVLGFFNLYTFRYSFVADHYQYLASLGLIVLVSSATALLLEQTAGWQRRAGQTACVVLLVVLAVLTNQQSRMYANAETLYAATIDRNPDCWLAHNNLGLISAEREHFDEAIREYRAALAIDRRQAEPHYNLGLALASLGQLDEAAQEYRQALESKPNHAEAHNNLGNVLLIRGQTEEAIAEYRLALELNPENEEAHYNLAVVLAQRGLSVEAIDHYRRALAIKPDDSEARQNLDALLMEQRGTTPGNQH